MRAVPPSPAMIAYVARLRAVIAEFDDIGVEVLLAGMAQVTGNLTALQDQTKFTVEEVMNVVAANIEEGNMQAIRGLVDMAPEGSA